MLKAERVLQSTTLLEKTLPRKSQITLYSIFLKYTHKKNTQSWEYILFHKFPATCMTRIKVTVLDVILLNFSVRFKAHMQVMSSPIFFFFFVFLATCRVWHVKRACCSEGRVEGCVALARGTVNILTQSSLEIWSIDS